MNWAIGIDMYTLMHGGWIPRGWTEASRPLRDWKSQCLFHCILLIKIGQKASSDSRGGETDSTYLPVQGWEELVEAIFSDSLPQPLTVQLSRHVCVLPCFPLSQNKPMAEITNCSQHTCLLSLGSSQASTPGRLTRFRARKETHLPSQPRRNITTAKNASVI